MLDQTNEKHSSCGVKHRNLPMNKLHPNWENSRFGSETPDDITSILMEKRLSLKILSQLERIGLWLIIKI